MAGDGSLQGTGRQELFFEGGNAVVGRRELGRESLNLNVLGDIGLNGLPFRCAVVAVDQDILVLTHPIEGRGARAWHRTIVGMSSNSQLMTIVTEGMGRGQNCGDLVIDLVNHVVKCVNLVGQDDDLGLDGVHRVSCLQRKYHPHPKSDLPNSPGSPESFNLCLT